MNLKVAESTMWRLSRVLLPYSTNEPIAIATGVAIRNEAMLRRALARPVNLGMKVVGRETTAVRRRRREVADAASFHGVSEDQRCARRPVVNWHEGGQGPALLLLNGYTASGLVWPESWLRSLEKHYRVIRIDNRGTGWSRSAPRPYKIGDLANDARDVLAACGIDRATVLGLSMGGMIAQELAIRHSQVVDKLVLVGTRPPTPAQIPPNDDAYFVLMQQPPSGADLHEFLAATWGQTVGESFAADHPEAIAEVAAQLMRRITPRSSVVDQARAIASWHGPARLRRLAVPTTVVHGNRDPLMPVGNGMRLARLIPNTTYLELPGVGHLVPHEAGDALLRVLDSK